MKAEGEAVLGGPAVISESASSSLVMFVGGGGYKPTRSVRMHSSRWPGGSCRGCVLLCVMEEVDDA